jgi:hypothetical protein
MITEDRPAKSIEYSRAALTLKGDSSYFSLSRRLSSLSRGHIDLDPTGLYRILTGTVGYSRKMYGGDRLFGLTLGLMVNALEQCSDILKIVEAGQVFLAAHLGQISAELLLREVKDLARWVTDAKSMSFSLRAMLRKVFLDYPTWA